MVRDSILGRGLANGWLLEADSLPIGYGGVWNAHYPGRLMEFWLEPFHRDRADGCYRELIRASGADAVEAQTNIPWMVEPLRALRCEVREEHILFEEGVETDLTLPGAEFRERRERDAGPDGDFVVELGGRIVGAGGFLCHYNAPFVDLYMAVSEESRGVGVGSWLIQELRGVVRGAGLVPAARCDVDNEASRRTLLKGGLRECGRIVASDVPLAVRT